MPVEIVFALIAVALLLWLARDLILLVILVLLVPVLDAAEAVGRWWRQRRGRSNP